MSVTLDGRMRPAAQNAASTVRSSWIQPLAAIGVTVMWDGVDMCVMCLDVPGRRRIAPVMGNVTQGHIPVIVIQVGLAILIHLKMPVTFQTVRENPTVTITELVTPAMILHFVWIVSQAGWARLAKNHVSMVTRLLQTVESASVTPAILGKVATRNVTIRERVSTVFVSAMITGKVLSVKFLVVLVIQIAPTMAVVILEQMYISVYVIQVGQD